MRREKRNLGEFEFYVMLAVARLGDGAFGGALRREIEERSSRKVAIGALYATLDRLGDKKLLRFRVEEPGPGRPGRARRYCLMTPAGEEALRRSADMLQRMMRGVEVRGVPLLVEQPC